MILSDEIKNNYKLRENKAHLYAESDYTVHSQREIIDCISDFLKREFKHYANLELLEIGAGNGTNADFFINMGFTKANISFNELLPERINAIKTNYPQNKIFEGNAIDIDFDKQYDVIFQSTVFTSILNQNDRDKLGQKMLGLLKQNGVIIWYDFIYNNPKNKNVRKVSVNELKKIFYNSSAFYYKKITLAPPIGRKVGSFYKLFNINILRTHILAIIKK